MKKWICFLYNHWNTLILFTGWFTTCPRIFPNFSGLFEYIQRNPWVDWMFTDIPGKFGDIPRNFSRKFQVCLPTFLGMFRKSPQNVQHLPDYSTTFLRMFVDILQKTTLLLFPTFPAFRSHSLNPAFIHGLYLIKYFDFQAWRKIQPIRLWMFPKLGP